VNVTRAAKAFEIVWDDGHISRFRLSDLRSLCDCANCREERDQRSKQAEQRGGRSLPVLGISTRDELDLVENVGRYAFGVRWRDGHNSIYSYNYLLESCPCDTCQQLRR
jgi:DUF971 family protein